MNRPDRSGNVALSEQRVFWLMGSKVIITGPLLPYDWHQNRCNHQNGFSSVGQLFLSTQHWPVYMTTSFIRPKVIAGQAAWREWHERNMIRFCIIAEVLYVRRFYRCDKKFYLGECRSYRLILQSFSSERMNHFLKLIERTVLPRLFS